MISPEHIRRHAFFAGFTPAQIKQLAMAGQELVVEAGHLLFNEGQPAESLFFLAEGELETLLRDDDGTDIPISTIPPGEPVGWSALIEPYIYTATVRTTRPSRIFVFSRFELARSMADPRFSSLMMQRLAEVVVRRLKDTQIQLLSLTTTAPAVG